MQTLRGREESIPKLEEGHLPLVLLIDDDPKNLQIIGRLLRNEHLRIAIAMNGEEGLERADQLHPDLILLDIMMPGIDGYEVCQRLKKDPDLSNIPIIFITGKTDSNSIVRGFEVGGVDYITKPFNQAELVARLRTQLELKHALDDREQLIQQLIESLNKVRQLTGLLPICSSCMKIRDDKGYWQEVELYIREHSDADFTYGICPACTESLYPGLC